MTCPKCDNKTEVIKSVVGATTTDRLRACPSHGRFWSIERMLRWVTGNPPATGQQPPANAPATDGQPAGNGSVLGGMGGNPVSLSLPSGNPAPTEPPDQTQARVEAKPRKRRQTDPVVGARAQAMVGVFCEEWKASKRSDYRPTPRDAGQVSQLAKTWTDVNRWREIVRAYLRKAFWGNKQPSLWDVAMTPNGHDAKAGAVGRPASRTDGNIDVISDWMQEAK